MEDPAWKQEALFDMNAPQIPGIPKVIDAWREAIKCPGCQLCQVAVVTVSEGDPWAAYVHNCPCGYTIMESEWQQVNWDQVKNAPKI